MQDKMGPGQLRGDHTTARGVGGVRIRRNSRIDRALLKPGVPISLPDLWQLFSREYKLDPAGEAPLESRTTQSFQPGLAAARGELTMGVQESVSAAERAQGGLSAVHEYFT